jgi:hypothetical protein
MLRFKVLAAAVALACLAVFARAGLISGPNPCILVGTTSLQIAGLPWGAELHVSFTDDPAMATVRVQVADNSDAADFSVIDDIDTAVGAACEGSSGTRTIAISSTPLNDSPVIYLSADGPADYRIFVNSKTFTARDTAALLVGATGGHRRLLAATL